MTSSATPKSPPRARLAFRVGVVGHRPNRLPGDTAGRAAINARLTLTLGAVKAAVDAFKAAHPDAAYYANEPVQLRAVSAMAEGADRDFAEAALANGYALCCPLPFAQEEYENDFTGPDSLEPGSVARFRDLLTRADAGAGLTLFELDGRRDNVAAAYGAAGRVVLNQSDLLVVVWDGADARGGGGTVATLREAINYHVPVLWIDARAPFGWAFMEQISDLDCLESGSACAPAWTPRPAAEDEKRLTDALAAIVNDELVRPHEAPDYHRHRQSRNHLADYFAEVKPRVNLGFIWKPLRDLVGSGRITAPKLFVGDFVSQIKKDWPVLTDRNGATTPLVASAVNGWLRTHFAWSDRLADVYADRHRSAFIVSSIFAAVAVGVALVPTAMAKNADPGMRLEIGSVILELAIIGVTVYLLNKRRASHERWLEYRVLAELIRELRLLMPMGGSRPLPRSPAHLATYGDPVQSWMYWQMRAIARDAGIPAVRATKSYVLACLAHLSDVAAGPSQGQLGFHQITFKRSEAIHHRLHWIAMWLFRLTIIGILIHLTLLGMAWPVIAHVLKAWHPVSMTLDWIEAHKRWLIVFSAVAPALGAAMANINNQGEFARLAKRSRAMADVFEHFKTEIDALTAEAKSAPNGVPLAAVTTVASQMAERMIEENLDWRVVVLDLPHVAG